MDRAAHGLADAGYIPHVVRVLALQSCDPSAINQHMPRAIARYARRPGLDCL